ncbi:MAG TPA: translation initiation factor IF-2 [Aliidongia sp.]|nr:translation initiation factor IF-2 [Aliidongia sp.]
MTDSNEQETKRPLSLARPGGRLELKKPIEAGSGQVRQSFPHGRSKTVTVEVKKKRAIEPPRPGHPVHPEHATAPVTAPAAPAPTAQVQPEPVAPKVAPTPAAPVQAAAPAPKPEPVVEPVLAPTPAPAPAEPEPIAEAPKAAAPVATPEPKIEPAPVVVTPAPRPAEPTRVLGPRPAARILTPNPQSTLRRGGAPVARTLTEEERAARMKAVQSMVQGEAQRKQTEIELARRARELETERARDEEERRRHAEETAAAEVRRRAEEEARRAADEAAKKQKVEDDSRREMAERAGKNAAAKVAALTAAGKVKPGVIEPEADDAPKRGAVGRVAEKRAPAPAPARTRTDQRRRTGKLTVTRALSDDDDRTRSLASVRRARERERLRMMQQSEQVKVVRDVVIPETITVQELANRMAERGIDVIKALMRNGIMATLPQSIDADTAELIVAEFGHVVKRVAESDIEIGLKGDEDLDEAREARPPVVTIMGHVDHGKTSLLDALRKTDVAAGEAGGITQHIGAYQVTLPSKHKITFIDTPGHQAFTAMRARGANVTDIVVLVVAADDGIKDQTVEAIRHAKAAGAPIIVAINKIDKPGADPNRVRQELLQHDLVVEGMGGDVLDIEVSALKKTGLDKLEEAILLQAELLDLRANPNRSAEGVIIEAKLERGRGAVATVLIQRGTLKVGDIFVAGAVWGRVRALVDDHGQNQKEAGPSTPIEVLGLNSTPLAGDDLVVVESESRAREIAEYRDRLRREKAAATAGRGTLEEMFSQITAGTAKELPIVIKGDVQGSVEAISSSLDKLSTDEVAMRVLHSGVGGINESDVILAKATGAVIVGFNVRANPAARDLARRDGVEIRYYAIIYDVLDDMKAALSGMLSPTLRERFLGNAAIREVFNITRVGKVAGCMVTDGVVRRGAKVRLLRDNVVIHEGSLKTLKRFKDEVREVRDGYECGMAFENYENIQVGDTIECFDVEEVARAL